MVFHVEEELALQITYEDRGGRGRGSFRGRGRGRQSTKLKLNVSSVTNMDISNMNVLPGRKNKLC